MPRVQYYYNNGTYVGEMSATQASSTAISAPPPSGLSSDPSGVYIGEVQNATSGGTWEILGVVDLDLVTPTQPNIGSAVWVGSGTSGWSGGGCYVPTTIHMSAAQQSSNPDQWAVTVSGTPYPPGTSWSWTITDAQGTLLSGSGSGSVDQGTYTASRTPIQVPYASFSGTLNYPGCSTTMVFNSGFTLVSQ